MIWEWVAERPYELSGTQGKHRVNKYKQYLGARPFRDFEGEQQDFKINKKSKREPVQRGEGRG